MLAKIGAGALTALALLFVGAMALFAWGFFQSGSAVGVGLGLGIAVLTPIIAWAIVREVRFGIATQKLGAAEAREDFLGDIDLGNFDAAKHEVEREPDNWRSWYRLALAYDLHRDRKGARRAMRAAIARFEGSERH